MRQHLQFINRFLLVAASVLTSSLMVAAPSSAATFAFSKGAIVFTDFAQEPQGTSTNIDTSTISISQGGKVFTTSEGIASLEVEPPEGFGYSQSIAEGEDRDYIGLSEINTSLQAIFQVDENTPFFFDFTAILDMKTLIDNSPEEKAIADGEVFFSLFDITQNHLLDFFTLEGSLITKDDDDFLIYDNSNNLVFNDLLAEFDFGGKQEFAIAYVTGSVKHSFTENTTLALVAGIRNRATVQVPEPSLGLAWLLVGVVAIPLKRKYSNHKL